MVALDDSWVHYRTSGKNEEVSFSYNHKTFVFVVVVVHSLLPLTSSVTELRMRREMDVKTHMTEQRIAKWTGQFRKVYMLLFLFIWPDD
jgi:hypothetical protein